MLCKTCITQSKHLTQYMADKIYPRLLFVSNKIAMMPANFSRVESSKCEESLEVAHITSHINVSTG